MSISEDDLLTQIKAAQDKIEEIENEIKAIEPKIEEKAQAAQQEIDSVQRKIDSVQDEIVSLQEQITTAEERIEQLLLKPETVESNKLLDFLVGKLNRLKTLHEGQSQKESKLLAKEMFLRERQSKKESELLAKEMFLRSELQADKKFLREKELLQTQQQFARMNRKCLCCVNNPTVSNIKGLITHHS